MQTVLPELREVVDLQRYAGCWYELVRTKDIPFEPPSMTDVRAVYTWDGERFGITNHGFYRGEWRKWSTQVKRITNGWNTRLEIMQPGAPVVGIYRILMLDTQDYQWAVVAGGDDNRYVWVLARERLQTKRWWAEVFRQLEQDFGINLDTLMHTPHTMSEQNDDDTATCNPPPLNGRDVQTVRRGEFRIVIDRQPRQ